MLQIPEHVRRTVEARIRETVGVVSQGGHQVLTCRAMSTSVRISFDPGRSASPTEFHQTVTAWLANFEASYSRFIPESIVGQINTNAGRGWTDVDPETDHLLDLCDKMYEATDGIFDAATLPLIRAWDWKQVPSMVPDADARAEAQRLSGWKKIERRPGGVRLDTVGMGIDFGGFGKEYAVDQILRLAQERGVTDIMIDIGQDIRVLGHGPGKDAWYIGLEEPDRPGQCWNCLRLTNGAVATSGDYFRSFIAGSRRYGHMLDPRSGEPVSNGCQAVTVIAPTCVAAGVLSTAAFILGPHEGLDLIRRQGGGIEGTITTETARHQTRRFSDYVAK